MADDLIARLKYWGGLDGAVPQGMKRDCALAAHALESALSELARLRAERERFSNFSPEARPSMPEGCVLPVDTLLVREKTTETAPLPVQSHEEKQG